MNRNIIIGVLLLAVVVIGALFFINKNNSTVVNNPVSGVEQNQKASVVVEFTDQGFSPASVNIKNGETVEWINKSSGGMWVASNPHPVHTDYPGFDEKSQTGANGTYFFTFTKTGSWGYHNHLTPSVMGVVNVQ